MNIETKAQRELRQATERLAAYLEHCRAGTLSFDASNAAVLSVEDAIRSAKFHGGHAANVQAEGADALAK